MSGHAGHEGLTELDYVLGQRRIVSVMGTVFTVDVRDLDPASAALDDVVAWWRWVDATFSTYRPSSQVSRLAAETLELADCAPEVRHVLRLCREAAAISGGHFTERYDGRLDPTGMVKGWSVELASQMLRRAGSQHHCISAGGDVRCVGVPESGERWRVGIVDPRDPGRLLAVVAAPQAPSSGLAVATSGTAERGHHIIDPVTGRPPQDLASISVVGSDLTLVDWAATAAFAMGHDARAWIEAMDGLDAYAVTPEGDYWYTDGFEARAELVQVPLPPLTAWSVPATRRTTAGSS